MSKTGMEMRVQSGSELGQKCTIEGLVSIDDRGQMIIPKELRESVGFKPGDKLALLKIGEEKGSGYIMIMKADILTDKIKEVLGPILE